MQTLWFHDVTSEKQKGEAETGPASKVEHTAFGRTVHERKIVSWNMRTCEREWGKRHARSDKNKTGRAQRGAGVPSGAHHVWALLYPELETAFPVKHVRQERRNKTLRATCIPLVTSIPKFVPGNDQARGLPVP